MTVRSPLVRLVAALAVVLAVVLATASAASAHAVVVSSQPGDRERLTVPPTEVDVTFSEGVSPDLGGLTVLNSKGDRVDSGPTTQPQPEVLRVGVQPNLAEGTYVTNYRVISADGHPISGAIVFSVGTAIDDAGVSGVKQQSQPGYEILGGIGRFGAYLGGLLAAGLAFFAWFIHDLAPDRSKLVRPALIAAAIGLVGQFIVVMAQSALASGSGLTAVFDPSLIGRVLGGSLGWATGVLVVGIIACAIAMKLTNVLVAQCVAFYGFVTVAVSFALWGHDIESEVPWLSISADVLHAATAALWFGGLVGLLVVLVGRARQARSAAAATESPSPAGEPSGGSGVAVLERVDQVSQAEPEATPADTVGVVIRFSTMATVSIVLLGIAGLALAWLELGSIGALFTTTYGRALIVKLVIVAFIAGLGVYNHFRLLPLVLGEGGEGDDVGEHDDEGEAAAMLAARERSSGGGDDDGDDEFEEPDFQLPEWRRLTKTVRLEALAIVAVLMVTAFLVNVTPGKTASGDLDAGPYTATKPVGTGKVELTISPAKAGSNAVHITYLTNDNKPADLAQSATLEMSLPDKGVGPLTRPAVKGGLGHYIILSMPDLSIAGTWKVTLVSRLGEFEQERTDFEVPITS